MKKVLAVAVIIVLAVCLGVTLISCESADFNIGICQLVTHDALDAATRGFQDALTEEMDIGKRDSRS